MEEANSESLFVLQVETARAVAAAANIAAIPGVDVLMIGPGDLSVSLGLPMELNNAVMHDPYARIAPACASAGRWWSAAVTSTQEAQACLALGAGFLCFGEPKRVLLPGYRALQQEYDALR